MIGQRNSKITAPRPQQTLRKEMTDAERALWRVIRGRQILGFKFRCQHPFDGYFLDFVCLEKKLVIEVDGGQHSDQIEHDEVRTRKLGAAGFQVIRFRNNEIFCDIEAVREKICTTLLESPPPIPTPTLPLKGRER